MGGDAESSQLLLKVHSSVFLVTRLLPGALQTHLIRTKDIPITQEIPSDLGALCQAPGDKTITYVFLLFYRMFILLFNPSLIVGHWGGFRFFTSKHATNIFVFISPRSELFSPKVWKFYRSCQTTLKKALHISTANNLWEGPFTHILDNTEYCSSFFF